MKDSVSTIRTKHAGWLVVSDYRSRILDPSAPDWFHLEKEKNASSIKTGHARKTWRVSWCDQTVIVKVFDRGRWLDRMKHLFIRHQAWREWKQVHKAHALGIPVSPCFAIGWSYGKPSRTVLILKYVERSQTLSAAWKQATVKPGGPERYRDTLPCIETTARLFACAHERGFVHRDAHPSNILIHPTTSGKHEAVWIDVHVSKICKGPASYRDRVRALAQLDHYFKRHAAQTERLRFFRSYVKHCSTLTRLYLDRPQPMRSFLTAIHRAEALHSVQLAWHRDRRLRRNSRYFMRIRLGEGWSGKVALILERRHAYPEADVPDRTPEDWNELLPSVIVHKSDLDHTRKALIWNDVQIDIRRAANLWTKILWTLGGSPYRTYFHHCHDLRHRDFPTPMVLGYLQHRSGGLIDAMMLIRPR